MRRKRHGAHIHYNRKNEKRNFISPGQVRALKITSKRFHDGLSFAAVRTEVRNADGTRVLEVVSHHAA